MAATKKTIVKTLEWLANEPNFKGKNTIQYLIWMNSVETAFKKGDIVEFTAPREYVYGNPVTNFRGVITEIRYYKGASLLEHQYMYTIVATIHANGSSYEERFTVMDKQECLMRKKKTNKPNDIRYEAGKNIPCRSINL